MPPVGKGLARSGEPIRRVIWGPNGDRGGPFGVFGRGLKWPKRGWKPGPAVGANKGGPLGRAAGPGVAGVRC